MESKVLLILSLSVMSTSTSPLHDILQRTDGFSNSPSMMTNGNKDFIETMEETHSLTLARTKRSPAEGLSKNEAVRIFDGISDVIFTNNNFPDDVNAFEFNGETFVIFLERGYANGTQKPHLVISKIEGKSTNPLAAVLWEGGGVFEVQKTAEAVLAVVTQPIKGGLSAACVVFLFDGKSLRQIQEIEYNKPTDVKLTTYFDKIYMAVSSEKGVSVFQWLGYHFDEIQLLNAMNIVSIAFYEIDHSIFLATVGDLVKITGARVNVTCSIWEQNLSNGLFECRQYLEPTAAIDVRYFRFRGVDSSEEDHFLVTAYTNAPAVIYKFDGQVFQPFQSIPDHQQVQWLPYESYKKDFALFLVSSKKVMAFGYDGWKFRPLNNAIESGALSSGCKSLRTVQKGNETLLVAINGEKKMGTVMRLSFKTQLSPSETSFMDQLCRPLDSLEEGGVEQLEHRVKTTPSGNIPATFYGDITFRNLTVNQLNAKEFGRLNATLVHEINNITMMVREIEGIITDIDSLLDSYTPQPIKIYGPLTQDSLTLNCSADAPCLIPKLTTESMNKENMERFYSSTASLKDGLKITGLVQFNNLRARNVTSIFVNNHQAKYLVNLHHDLVLKGPLHVNGAAVFQGNAFVRGEIQGALLDREHAVLVDGNQTLAGRLMFNSGTVRDLTLKGSLNGASLSELMEKSPHFRDTWDDLTVLNLTVNGRLGDRPISELLGKGNPQSSVEVDKIFVDTGVVSGVKLSDLVRISNGTYRLNSSVTSMKPVVVDNLQVSSSINDLPLPALMKLAADQDMGTINETVTLRNLVGDRVIVRGKAAIKNIVNSEGDSLSDITKQLDNESFLSESISRNDAILRASGFKSSDMFEKDHTMDCAHAGVNYTIRFSDFGDIIYEFNSSMTINDFVANNLNITGTIDNLNWTELVSDAVFKDETVTVKGQKIVDGYLNVAGLTVESYVNGKTVDEIVAFFDNIVVNGDLSLNSSINVSRGIFANGMFLFKSDENEDIVFDLNNAVFNGNLNATAINNINMKRFFEDTAHVNKGTYLKTVNFVKGLAVKNLTTSGLLNGVNFTESVVSKNANETLVVDGHWVFKKNVAVDGDLVVDGDINGMDLESLCEVTKGLPKVIVAGSLETITEPKIEKTVNNIDVEKLPKQLWLKNEKVTLLGNVHLPKTEIRGKSTSLGKINGISWDQLSGGYLSKTISRRMQAPIEVVNLTVEGRTRAPKVTGEVNGLSIGKFAATALRHDIDQNFTGRIHLHELQVSDIRGNFTFNKLNLSSDVLRYDVEGAAVFGEKSVSTIAVENLTVLPGVKLQGIDIGRWMEDAVLKNHTVIQGNVSFTAMGVDGKLSVNGLVGPIQFDSDHLLTKKGNQTVSGQKIIMGDLQTDFLNVDHHVNDVNLKRMFNNTLRTDEDVVIASPLEIYSLGGSRMTVEGDMSGVNVTRFCHLAQDHSDVNDFSDDYSKLLIASQQVYNNLAHGAYFFHHFRVIQKVRPNVTAVAAVPGVSEALIAVFKKFPTENNVTLMGWDPRDKLFKPRNINGKSYLTGNTTLVASGPSFLVVETWNKGGSLVFNDQVYSVNATQASCAVPFYITPEDVCLFVSQNTMNDSVMCAQNGGTSLIPHQTFNSTACVQVAIVKAGQKTWLAVIGKKLYRPPSEVYVTVFSLRDGQKIFYPRQDLAMLHPVSVTAIAHGRYSYLAVASQHQPESVRSSVITIFRYVKQSDKWMRYQEIAVEAPLYVRFDELPSGQLALYMLTANPARAFIMYMYRGVEGFVEETAGYATKLGRNLSTFNASGIHYVFIGGNGHGQILQTELRGRRPG